MIHMPKVWFRYVRPIQQESQEHWNSICEQHRDINELQCTALCRAIIWLGGSGQDSDAREEMTDICWHTQSLHYTVHCNTQSPNTPCSLLCVVGLCTVWLYRPLLTHCKLWTATYRPQLNYRGSACTEVPISGLGPDRDQCPNMVPKKAQFASQVPKITNVILNCVLMHWYVCNALVI